MAFEALAIPTEQACIEQFRAAIQSAGLEPPDDIQADGTLHRFPSNGRRGDDSGWYVLHGDGIPAGSFGCWRAGLSQSWCAKADNAMTQAERDAHQRRVQAMRAQREADLAQRQQHAAKLAAARWEAAGPAVEHPYLKAKGVKAHGLRAEGEGLLIPMRDTAGTLHSLQVIDPEGGKRFQPGGRVKGCYHSFGKPGRVLVVAEGYATGASIHEATGHAVATAFNAGNLRAVAEALHQKYPALKIIIAGDDDHRTEGNPGLTKAREAAQAVGGLLAVPKFPEGRGEKDTDFNDLHRLAGLEAVKSCIEGAQQGGPQTQEPTAPEPLRAPQVKAEPYPVDALGPVLGGAVHAIHEVVKAPLALCAQSVLASAALAAQAHFDVKLPWGQRRPLSLFLLTVGESGERKSAVDDVVLGAAKAQEKAAMADYLKKMAQYEDDLAAWQKATQSKRVDAEAMDKPIAPICPLRFVSDPTAEGLYRLLVMSQPSIALFSDEGGLLIGGHALNGDNFLKTVTRWSKMWDGAPFDRVRAGDAVGVLYGRRMALHQLAQGDVMVKLLSDRLANGQGLLARCLVAWPQSTIGTRQAEAFEWAGNRPELKRLFAVLSDLLESSPRTSVDNPQELDPVELPLSPEAAHLALQAGNQFETLMHTGNDLAELRDRAAKALENACRIAGVLAAVEHGIAARQIEVDHLSRALVLVQWYLAEALRIRGAAAVPQSVLDAESLSNWLQVRGLRMFRTHSILNSGPSHLRNKPRLMAAIEQLVEAGYLIENPPGTVIDGVKARKSWEVQSYVV